MKDKFNLTREQSVFLAKKKWDEAIFCGMRMENRNVTFPETQTILAGVNVGRVSLDDIQAILNMRDAWRFMLGSLDDSLDIAYLCRLNSFVSRNESLAWGVLRTGDVGIAGVNYRPPLPNKDVSEKELASLLTGGGGATEKALNVFLWGTRAQIFWDGNKRTSLLAANKILLEAGSGLLSITENLMPDFQSFLSRYYESGEGSVLRSFLYDNALHGIVFSCNAKQ